ncbi:hypothetical protein [Hufsiella ginkgonis]|uniref:Uncharacterized protein n=1 Tax=Hufsiella ginkgonis TaxID=2695274 RepID=A0A7K1Y155_9SPHI|nr:hypothetical protein [Hufsiella ginkgonis]MXV16847.1 hypothetical protein [Hufsiella ginkgonis]
MARSSALEVEKRLRQVQEWIMEGQTWSYIIHRAVTDWAITSRQAARYYAESLKVFVKDNDITLEQKKAFYISSKRKLIRDMDPDMKKTPQGARTINKILDSMAQLDGVMIQKVEVTDNTFLEILKAAK